MYHIDVSHEVGVKQHIRFHHAYIPQLPRPYQCLNCASRWTAEGLAYDRHDLEHRHIYFLCGLFGWTASRKFMASKGRPEMLLPSMMMAWSIGTICMPAMTSGAGSAVCRFFIGLAEAPFFPGITLSRFCTGRQMWGLRLMDYSDIFLVHQRREPNAHGHMARR